MYARRSQGWILRPPESTPKVIGLERTLGVCGYNRRQKIGGYVHANKTKPLLKSSTKKMESLLLDTYRLVSISAKGKVKILAPGAVTIEIGAAEIKTVGVKL